MRREQPNRHGRAADALIASYLRELLIDDGPHDDASRPDAAPTAPREREGAPLGAPTRRSDDGLELTISA